MFAFLFIFCNWFRFCVISSTCWSWFKVLQLLTCTSEPSSRCLVGSRRSKFLIWTNLRIPTFRGSFFKRRALPWNEMHLETFIKDGLQNFKCRACKGKGKKVLIMGLVPPRNPIQFQFTLSLSQNGQDMTRQQKRKLGSEMLNFFKLVSYGSLVFLWKLSRMSHAKQTWRMNTVPF